MLVPRQTDNVKPLKQERKIILTDKKYEKTKLCIEKFSYNIKIKIFDIFIDILIIFIYY